MPASFARSVKQRAQISGTLNRRLAVGSSLYQ